MAINCIVIVREVWDTRDLIGDVLDDAGRIKDGALDTRFEPEDLNALETALRIKDEHGGKVTAVSVGAPKSVDVLRECLYRGVDEVLRVDADPAGLDAQAKAVLLAEAVQQIGAYDLILIGTTVVDAENSLPGAHLAGVLGIPQVSWVDEIEEIADGRAVGKRAVEMGYESVDVPFPALMSIGVALLEDDPRAPRSAKAMLKLKMKKADIPMMTPRGNPAEAVTTSVAGYEKVPERVIESKEVDPEDETELRTMLEEMQKGD